MEHKSFDIVEVKADGEAGEFSALASVFGNVDHGGDRMLPGSFDKTLDEWKASGKALPIIWSHDHSNPMSYIGSADPRAVLSTERGLLVQGKVDVNDGNPVADQVYKLMKNGLVTGWSFGYTVPKGGQKRDKEGVNEVSEVRLIEAGPTLKGMNDLAQLESIKSDAPDAAEMVLEEGSAKTTLAAEQVVAHIESLTEDERAELFAKFAKTEVKETHGKEPPSRATSKVHDPGMDQARREFAIRTHGIDLSQPPKQEEEPPARLKAEGSIAELRLEAHRLILETLTGSREVR